MKLLFSCPFWGSEHMPFKEFAVKVKKAGYDGVEMSLPIDDERKRFEIFSELKTQGLLFIGQHWETATTDFNEHKKQYNNYLLNLAKGMPLLIDSQTGKDFFTFEQNMELINDAFEFSTKTGIKVVHETHRGKFSFAAHITKIFLESNPLIRIGADFSHWTNVAESLLENQPEAMALAISRADHIHARVGFEQGPQIPDPRAEEWKPTLNRYFEWWDSIVGRARSENREYFTITPEFGPVPYMTILPNSKIPIANQWDINLFMKDMLKERYNN
jgi:sugar phosphate isomerase/epimerase